MKTVFVLQHVHIHDDLSENVKMIGVCTSTALAAAAMERAATQSGFRDHPQLVNPLSKDYRSGFTIDEYALDTDHWLEGYG